MGSVDALHLRVFDALQERHIRLDQERTLFEWIAAQGVDAKRFRDLYRSFTVEAELSRALQLADQYRIDSVPSVVVGGKYLTSASLAGSKEAVPQVLDALVAMVRKEMKGRT